MAKGPTPRAEPAFLPLAARVPPLLSPSAHAEGCLAPGTCPGNSSSQLPSGELGGRGRQPWSSLSAEASPVDASRLLMSQEGEGLGALEAAVSVEELARISGIFLLLSRVRISIHCVGRGEAGQLEATSIFLLDVGSLVLRAACSAPASLLPRFHRNSRPDHRHHIDFRMTPGKVPCVFRVGAFVSGSDTRWLPSHVR